MNKRACRQACILKRIGELSILRIGDSTSGIKIQKDTPSVGTGARKEKRESKHNNDDQGKREEVEYNA